MPRKFIRRIMPNHETIRASRSLKVFGRLLHDANLWHMNRRSAAGAFAVGLFCAFVPVPFQMFLAAAMAILFRVNLPLSVTLVWVSNPITMPPLFYLCYLAGAWILDEPTQPFAFEASWDWLVYSINTIGAPFLLGCFIFAVISALVGYVTIRLLWRQSVVNAWRLSRIRAQQALRQRRLKMAQRRTNEDD